MKTYWSNSLNCKRCGFTNRYFYMSRYVYKDEVRYAKTKSCLECAREVKKEYRREHQRTDEFKAKRRNYIIVNKDRIKKLNLINAKDYRERKKQTRMREELKERMTYRVLI